jgi:deoxyribonuclease-4
MTMSLSRPSAADSQAASIPSAPAPAVRLGAHVSGGGLKGIPEKASSIGCEGVQIFASSPQMWRPPSIKPAEAEAFRAACVAANLGPIAVHAIYLVNPASEDDEMRAKTVTSLVATLKASEMLGASVVVTHLGSAKGSPKAEALARSCRTFADVLGQYSGPVTLLFETSAGAGETMGGTFDELGEMIRTLGAPANLGVCIDTAHIFTAGYDLRTAEDLEKTLETFDHEVGLDLLGAVHLNDSKAPFGSNKDRHENIGDGEIGAEALGRFVRHPALGTTPLYLEVPGYSKDGPDLHNMGRVFDLAGRPFSRTAELAAAQEALAAQQAEAASESALDSAPAAKPAPARKPRSRKAAPPPTA